MSFHARTSLGDSRVPDGTVVEIMNIPDGMRVDEMFHADLVPTIFPCSDLVQVGWVHADGVFTPPPPVVYTKAQLLTYAFNKQTGLLNSGIKVDIGTTQAPLVVDCETTANGLGLLNIAAAAAAADPAATTPWVTSAGAVVTLNASQVAAISAAVQGFIKSTFASLAAAASGIGAGTITSPDRIDAVSPAWPSNG